MISSASISFRPRPNRCGASRLSGRVTTSPPKPAEPRGRPWHPAQLSASPAPMMRSTSMFPAPSPMTGPCPSSRVNFRWKSCRPRRIARNGSIAMTFDDVLGSVPERPSPIWLEYGPPVSGREMPSLAVFGALFLSTSCPASRVEAASINTPAQTSTGFIEDLLPAEYLPVRDRVDTCRRHISAVPLTPSCESLRAHAGWREGFLACASRYRQ